MLIFVPFIANICNSQDFTFSNKNNSSTSLTSCYTTTNEIAFSVAKRAARSTDNLIQMEVCRIRQLSTGPDTNQCRIVSLTNIHDEDDPVTKEGIVRFNDFGDGAYVGKVKFFINGIDTPKVIFGDRVLNFAYTPLNFQINNDPTTLTHKNNNVLSCEGLKISTTCAGTQMSISVQEVSTSDLFTRIGTELIRDLTTSEVNALKNSATKFDVANFCAVGVGTNTITLTDGHAYQVKLIDRNAFGQWMDVTKNIIYKSKSFDLFMADNPNDNGFEPTDKYENIYSSPDLWNRRGPTPTAPFVYSSVHQEPDYSPTYYNRPYVRIHNKGCATSTASSLRIFWTRARLDETWETLWKYNLSTNFIIDPDNITHRAGGGEITIAYKDIPSSPSLPKIIPPIAANSSFELNPTDSILWKVPDPAWYGADTFQRSNALFQGQHRPIVCMLAILNNSTDNLSFSSSLTPVDPYVRRNNNVVTRNMALVDDPQFLVINPGGWDYGWSTAVVNNGRGSNQIVNLRLDLLPGETFANEDFGNFGEILIGLDAPLWQRWTSTGNHGSGFEIIDDGILRVTDYNSVILSGINMLATENLANYRIGVRFNYFSSAIPPAVPYSYAYQISEEFPGLNDHGSNAVLYTSVQPASAAKSTSISANQQKDNKGNSASIIPNPFGDGATAQVNIVNRGLVSITVSDMMGRIVETLCDNKSLEAGQHSFAIDGTKYIPGVYIVNIRSIGYQSSLKIIKQ